MNSNRYTQKGIIPCSEIHHHSVPFYPYFTVLYLQWLVKVTIENHLLPHTIYPSIYINTPGWLQRSHIHSFIVIQYHIHRSILHTTTIPSAPLTPLIHYCSQRTPQGQLLHTPYSNPLYPKDFPGSMSALNNSSSPSCPPSLTDWNQVFWHQTCIKLRINHIFPWPNTFDTSGKILQQPTRNNKPAGISWFELILMIMCFR